MLAIPSIDIRSGVCAEPRTSAGGELAGWADPIAVARAWGAAGFRRVHVRDLDALLGRGSNAMMVEEIARDGAAEVQAETGTQRADDVERLLDAGAAQVVLGPRAIEEIEWTEELATTFPGVLVVGSEVREHRVVTRGWIRRFPLDIFDVVDELSQLPLAGLLVAMGNGTPDLSHNVHELNLFEDLAERCAFPVIAAGGISTMNDVRALEHRGVSAVLLDGLASSSQLDARALASEFGG